MLVKNPQGRIVSVPEKTWEFLKNRKDFELIQEQRRSTDYTVREAKEILADMNESESADFLQGETRKSLI